MRGDFVWAVAAQSFEATVLELVATEADRWFATYCTGTADKDAIIISGARAKHIDPSVKSWELGKGGLPTTAKLGIDATIPEGVPRSMYRRIKIYGSDTVRLENFE